MLLVHFILQEGNYKVVTSGNHTKGTQKILDNYNNRLAKSKKRKRLQTN